MQETSIERIIDANVNRAAEGLRVMEEISRFVLENKKISLQLKSLRAALRKLAGKVVWARNVLRDVGRKTATRNESKRADLLAVFSANAKRVEEALRVLEEFSKLTRAEHSRKFKTMRFQVYALEKKIVGLLKKDAVSAP